MSKLELIRGLYEYNEWANNHVLEAASALTEEEFSERRGASFESVEGNLAHIIGAQVVWLERWTGGSNPRSVLEFQKTRGLSTIREAFAQSHGGLRAFVGTLSDRQLDENLAYKDSAGRPHERVMWQLMAHVVNHGTQFRGEAAVALTEYGQSPGDLDMLAFFRERTM